MSVNVTITEKYVNKGYYDKEYSSGSTGTGNTCASVHREMAELTSLSNRHVVVTFDSEFPEKPLGTLEVFRYVEQSGGYIKQNVLFTYPSENWLTATGFTIDIMSFEDLSGIIIFYYYTK